MHFWLVSSPCTCNAQPLSWRRRCAASLWFHSPRLLRGRSHSVGLRPRGWSAEASGPAATTRWQSTIGAGAAPNQEAGRFPGDALTCEELSSSAACDERKASDWLRDETLHRALSNLPRPRLWGGDVSESLATPSSSSKVGKKKNLRRAKSLIAFGDLQTCKSWRSYFNDMKPHTLAIQIIAPKILEFFCSL